MFAHLKHFTAATCIKNVGTGQQNAEKVWDTKKKQLEQHGKNIHFNWKQVSNIINHKK